eukprot:m.29260 g.29260  ORF g.29260 m.29260 type:complete len:290 (-) comp14310_c0_seq1:384-1253(-)
MLLLVLLGCVCGISGAGLPQPYTRELKLTTPPMQGTDVTITQHLLAHSFPVSFTGAYDSNTASVVEKFQQQHQLSSDGIVGPATATAILKYLSADNYKDNGTTAHDLGYLYKVLVPVHRNRSIETTASLFAGNGTLLFKFRVRTHGHDVDNPSPWPDFNSTGDGLNSFSPDGNTPTGLAEFDFNSPEGEPKFYGPYPINRVVKGLAGNMEWLVPHIRDGLLLHTGEWPNWSPPDVMPNSEGCIHSWPENIKKISEILPQLGVQMHKNPGGALPYPYKPQGIISVYMVDE